MRSSILVALQALASSVVIAAPHSSLSKRCVNSATDRSCWGDYDLTTNYYDEVPDTGVTREVSQYFSMDLATLGSACLSSS